ncbi:MAG TPA: hypothetical protein VFE58_00615 [Tepidisphaeraceae bacterium]|nr:hypothetical protein [Tepidisphaeraceae bacterium]
MTPAELQTHLLNTRSLRIGEHMASYILRHTPSTTPLPILAQDARTGLPLATTLPPSTLTTKPS